jgi:hypothetical protein
MLESFRLALRNILRDGFALALLVIAPAVFLGITYATAPLLKIPIKLIGLPGFEELALRQRDVLVVFISSSVEGFLSAFLASEMFSDRKDLGKIAVLSGMSALSWAGGKLLALGLVMTGVSLWTFGIEICLVPMKSLSACFLGSLLLSLVYGTAGATIGLGARDTLRSVLCVLILADVDAAWLQNPVYYTYAQRNEIVKRFPAFFPIQEVLAGAFAGKVNSRAVLGALAYAAILALPLAVALAVRYGRVGRAGRTLRGRAGLADERGSQ